MIVGRVRNAHGIRGEVVVESLTSDPDALFAVGLPAPRRHCGRRGRGCRTRRGRAELTIRRSVPFKGGWILRFAEIRDRTAADLWRSRYLLVPVGRPRPRRPRVRCISTIWWGFGWSGCDGAELGRVEALYEMPQGLVLEVRTAAGTVMVPYRPEVVSRVDMARRDAGRGSRQRDCCENVRGSGLACFVSPSSASSPSFSVATGASASRRGRRLRASWATAWWIFGTTRTTGIGPWMIRRTAAARAW